MQTTTFPSPSLTASYLLRALSPLAHQAAQRAAHEPSLPTAPRPSLRQRSRLRATEGGFELQVAIPGVAAENVELEIDGTQLQLRVKQPAVASEEYRVIHRERSLPTGSLELSFRNEVDAQSTSASLVDGVLTISGKYLVRSHKVAIRVAKPTEQSNA